MGYVALYLKINVQVFICICHLRNVMLGTYVVRNFKGEFGMFNFQLGEGNGSGGEFCLINWCPSEYCFYVLGEGGVLYDGGFVSFSRSSRTFKYGNRNCIVLKACIPCYKC